MWPFVLVSFFSFSFSPFVSSSSSRACHKRRRYIQRPYCCQSRTTTSLSHTSACVLIRNVLTEARSHISRNHPFDLYLHCFCWKQSTQIKNTPSAGETSKRLTWLTSGWRQGSADDIGIRPKAVSVCYACHVWQTLCSTRWKELII